VSLEKSGEIEKEKKNYIFRYSKLFGQLFLKNSALDHDIIIT